MSISTMTLSEFVEASKDAGYHFFSDSTMAFFSSEVHGDIYMVGETGYFVTSEQDPNGFAWDGERRFTVRQAVSLTEVRTVSEFGEFSTEAEAWASVPD
jgi:hypothetical protein